MMRLTKWTLAVLVAVGASSSVSAFQGHQDLLQNFGGQFRCPYADQWLTKGPEQAAIDLGLKSQDLGHKQDKTVSPPQSQQHLRRKAQEQQLPVRGSCTYTETFSGASACLEMRGEGWTTASLQERCSTQNGSFSASTPCPVPQGFAGTCIVQNNGDASAVEATLFDFSMGGCAAAKNACKTFVRGSFVGSEACADGESSGSDSGESGESQVEVFCEIAPGPIGAAHQAGYASGYFSDCPGTPAESSPYQWPTAWAADVESKSMAFGSDTVVYHSIGSVFYRLDKNWKRADTTYTRGIQRGLGQSPCEPEDIIENDPGAAGTPACRRDSDRRMTMLHRGSKMWFITWKNDTEALDDDITKIEDCGWLDLQVVGNVRPDWFMDKVGADTDVQYLGNQHVYHEGEPRLVKQWRKKDFASQYFTMSMLENTDASDGIHWPMILNVPGEGFGDDFLSEYTNHRLLTDAEDGLFLLDQALEASGSSCPRMNMGEGGVAGPPAIDDEDKIPSNLEVDPNSWYSNEYTFSPVWEPPSRSSYDGEEESASNENAALTQAGILTASSCYDKVSKQVQLAFAFDDIAGDDATELPWIALGYRPDGDCVMNKGGMDTEIILIATDPMSETTMANKGLLPAVARSGQSSDLVSVYTSLSPLESAAGYSNVTLMTPTLQDDIDVATQTRSFDVGGVLTDRVVLSFHQSVDEAPEVMHLMYAVGSGPSLGYHATRQCFSIAKFPSCGAAPNQDKAPLEETSGSTTVLHASVSILLVGATLSLF